MTLLPKRGRFLRGTAGIIAAAMASLLPAASCDKQLADTFSSQEKNIESLVAKLKGDNPAVTIDYADGSTRITTVQGEGEVLGKGGTVSFHYAGHFLSGQTLNVANLFATNYKDYASFLGWSVSDSTVFTPKTLNLSESDIVEGLKNGLPGVKAGDECYVLFSGKHGFGKKTGVVPANAALVYRLWILRVSNP